MTGRNRMVLSASYNARARLAARGERPAAFGLRCIPADCVAPPSHIPDMLGRRALSSGRLAALGATPDVLHGLLVCAALILGCPMLLHGAVQAPAQPAA